MIKKTLTIFLAVYLSLVASELSDSTQTEGSDAFCGIVNVFLNTAAQKCQALLESDPDAFCRSNCSELLAQVNFDCGYADSYLNILSTCARDPIKSQLCREVQSDQTILANLTDYCSGNDSCTEDCQAIVNSIGCCVNYVGSNISLAQCIVQNCTTVQVNTSTADALKCYQSHIQNSSTLNGCHDQLIASTISENSTVTSSFCDGNCPEQVANLYSKCGLSRFASIIKNGCEKDEKSRYCGNVIHPSINPEWEVLVDKAVDACKDSDCNNAICSIAVDAIGCCLALDIEVNSTISTLLPTSSCDIKSCTTAADSSTLPLSAMSACVLYWVLLACVFFNLV